MIGAARVCRYQKPRGEKYQEVLEILFCSLQALMFWVVDNFLMKKHRTKAKQEEREEDSRGNSKVRYRRAMSHDDSESEVSECHCVTVGCWRE